MNIRSHRSLLFLLVVLVAVCGIYLSGLGNQLVFDDGRLTDGSIFGVYGSLGELRPRLLSYGSFVWLGEILGEGWKGQRVFNLMLHLATAGTLWLVVRSFMDTVCWPTDDGDGPSSESIQFAAAAGAAIFALNPVAVYSVAYLIQRSVLMATFFSALALLLVLKAARGGTWLPLLGALLMYLMAVLSKEHAVMLPLPAVALYLCTGRPSRRLVVAVATVGLVVVGVGVTVLASYYAGVVGQVFDPRSTQFIAQMERAHAGVAEHAYALSVMNQAWLFFRYGLLWVLPWVGWLSADLRPAFPLSFTDFPQVLGLPLFVVAGFGAIFLMAKFRDWRRYLGFALFLPVSLFATEFGTVWVQDPFVLYRSYLWALGMPFLFAFPFVGARPRTIMLVAGAVALLFGAQAFERVQSFRSDATLWSDAADKLEVNGNPAEVGKGRAYMWRGNDFFVRQMFNLALEDYDRALQVGEAAGEVQYHRAAALNMLGRDEDALTALKAAEASGGTPVKPAQIPFLKTQILARMHRYREAGEAATVALAAGLDSDERVVALTIRAQAHVQSGEPATAVDDYGAVLAIDPTNRAARVGRALGLRALGRMEEAVAELDRVLAQGDGPDVRFGRALVMIQLGRREEALNEARRALALKPGDPALRGLVAKLEGS